MNFKNDRVLMLVVAFFLGFYAHQILKGCNVIEGNGDFDSFQSAEGACARGGC